MAAKFVVGIDLGTTHSAVASARVGAKTIEVFPIRQLVGPGEVAEAPLLPSAIYLPAEGELPAGGTKLPWGEPSYVVGELARRLGAKVPDRLVSSAKSWLSHAGVDREAPILPWTAPADVVRLSPVEATSRILAHMRSAWDSAHPDAPLRSQELVVTLPASFDDVARELTVRALRDAGLPNARLLEEPQAAFYDFIHQHEASLADAVGDTRIVLVVDVGGGTTDLTLVRVARQASGPPKLERIAVGEHLVLGGDNMDLALARQVEERLGGERLDAAQTAALVQSCRIAKETLLGGRGPERYGISVLGRGAKLLGGARTVQLEAEEARRILLDGFLPLTAPDELPVRRGRVALSELGLPYASDPAISRHVCAFLRRHAQAAAESGVTVHAGLPRPDALLLNGGPFNAPVVREQLARVFENWFPGQPVPVLGHESLDLAVARGAAYYGLVRRGFGVRIAGGSPRAYYVGVEGKGGTRSALCVVPRGLEEGSRVSIESPTFDLLVDRPATFPLFSSTGDRADAPGDVVPLGDDLDPLPPLHTVLRVGTAGETARPGAKEPATLAVRLDAALTELGTLELHLRTAQPPERRWRLEFSLRGGGGGAAVAPIDQLPKRFDEAKALLERAYGKAAQPVEAREIKGLWRGLEKILGDRDGWSSAVNRELWGVVLGGAQKRRRSADHERVFFQLAGFGLRPGFGAPLDEWRVGELWKVFPAGVQYVTEKANWSEWWILWRRVTGGLDAGQQRQILERIRPWLEPPKGRFPSKPKGPKAEGFDEMVRLLASLERLPASDKAEAGGWILARLEKERASWWPLGRLGARRPFYGSAHDVVAPEVAEGWLDRLLALDWKKTEGASFAAAQIARRTGDRARDLPDERREEVATRLAAAGAPAAWIEMVREVGELSMQDEMRVFGDTLPAGLRLA